MFGRIFSSLSKKKSKKEKIERKRKKGRKDLPHVQLLVPRMHPRKGAGEKREKRMKKKKQEFKLNVFMNNFFNISRINSSNNYNLKTII